jgi:hypothetical protein
MVYIAARRELMDVMSSLLVVASSEEADGGDAIGANASTEIARRAADTNLSNNILDRRRKTATKVG